MVLTQGDFATQETFGNFWRQFWFLQLGGKGTDMLLASNGQRQGMLLNILQRTGKFPTTKNYLAQHVNSAKLEKLCYILL